MSLPAISKCKIKNVKLKHIQHLLLDLLQLVLHLHHDTLHLGLIALAAERIDLASHLLSDESELLAMATGIHLAVHSLQEVVEVVGEAMLLLVDVELLDVVDHLLLQSVLVIVDRKLLKTIKQVLTDLLSAILLVWLYACQQRADVSDLLSEYTIERLTFLLTESNDILQRLRIF